MKRDQNDYRDIVKAALLQRLDHLIQELLPAATRAGHQWRVGGVDGAPGESMAIEAAGPKAGLWLDFATGETGDVFDLIQQAHQVGFPAALKWAANWAGVPQPTRTSTRAAPPAASSAPPTTTANDTRADAASESAYELPLPTDGKGQVLPVANERVAAGRAKRLLGHPKALAWLHARQLTDATIKHFHLGLHDPAGATTALSYPLLAHDGTARQRYTNGVIPDVTVGDKPKEWTAGQAATYWVTPAAGRQDLLIVEGPRDGWRVWQEIQGSELGASLAIISSSHGTGVPNDWKDPRFFARWRNVYVGQDADDAGDAAALRVSRLANRSVRRARPPASDGVKDWTDWLNAGATVADLSGLLASAAVLEDAVETTPSDAPGYYAVDAVEISGAWTGTHLYVPYRVREQDHEDGQTVMRYDTLVLRSDGQTFSVQYAPAPEGTPLADRVLVLTDGTRVRRRPVVDEFNTSFSLAAIHRFITARRAGRSALTRSPAELVAATERQLRRAAVLPYENDYTLLALTALTSYVQRVFAAVPLVLLNGAPGSGKTQLADALAQVSANGTVVNGQTSVASAIRIVDLTNGLVAFDDLEAIATRAGSRGADFSELVQMLKVSYKQATSKKSVTIVDRNGGMRLNTLDFYGVKVLTNTSGVDEILGTRVLTVRTRKLDKQSAETAIQAFSQASYDDDAESAAVLRGELHIWAMENAARLHEIYQQSYARTTNRADEIAAPLRAIADLIADPVTSARLDGALAAQAALADEVPSDEELLELALTSLVHKGYSNQVTLQQVQLEMERLVGADWGVENKTEIPAWRQPKWIGRALRRNFLVHGREERPRLWPGGLQARLYTLADDFVKNVLASITDAGGPVPQPVTDPLAFCAACPCRACEYRATCTWQEQKQAKIPDDRIDRMDA